MLITGMPYNLLISVVCGVTNLVPTFGPFAGAAIGGVILLLVNPGQAMIFLVWTLILQLTDGYIIKPKLFGNSLGVSGLMILIAVIVFGKIAGIIGIILAIPAAAIIEYMYKDIIITHLENRKKQKPQVPESDSESSYE
jgi:predicted PurR-regulated permease PerM